jgi:indolepyruvate ferredoxin oxidoreductase
VWPDDLTIRPRQELDEVQRELAAIDGVTILIYDQICAAEKRRRRKRGEMEDPDRRILINELLCEGCGDCGVKSNCVSIQPLETEFGRKRMIDQSSCNKDYSCVEGFCPALVSVYGARPKKAAPAEAQADVPLPRPVLPEIGKPYGILVTGVGGTGVVTIGAILGMAAHLEGKGCGSIDMAGLAQKGGAVFSHVKIGAKLDDIHAIRVAAGEADLILGCDLVVSSTKRVLAAIRKDETGVLVNTAEIYPGDFTRNADFSLPIERIKRTIRESAGGGVTFVDATGIARVLLGNSIAANMFMLGLAWQKGFVPLEDDSILHAIALNGEAVAMNQEAFLWGRRYAADPASITALITPHRHEAPAVTLEEQIARRVAFLTAYQDATYAAHYREAVAAVARIEREKTPGKTALTEAVMRYLFKLMAVKDEYEVARLYTDGSFAQQAAEAFDGDLRFAFHLAPPLLARKNAKGEPIKSTFGSWILPLFRTLAALKGLRGTVFDIFGYTQERRDERRLIAEYENLIEELTATLTPETHELAVALASIPEKIRGFGHVKLRHLTAAKAEEAALLEQWRAGPPPVKMAAE